MHFVILVSFWVAVVIWVIRLAQNSSPSKMVQRTIKAPDGRVAIFTVPANEPYAVSIGRMYPEGIPEGPPLIEAPKVIEAYTDWRSVPYKQPEKRDAMDTYTYVFLGMMGLVVIGALAVGKSVYDREPIPPNTQADRGPIVQRAEVTPSLNAVRGNSAVMERVRLKTGANIRNAGSRSGAILRVANQGDVLTKFSEVNGWLQVGPVGAVVPEGWVAASTIGPNRQ